MGRPHATSATEAVQGRGRSTSKGPSRPCRVVTDVYERSACSHSHELAKNFRRFTWMRGWRHGLRVTRRLDAPSDAPKGRVRRQGHCTQHVWQHQSGATHVCQTTFAPTPRGSWSTVFGASAARSTRAVREPPRRSKRCSTVARQQPRAQVLVVTVVSRGLSARKANRVRAGCADSRRAVRQAVCRRAFASAKAPEIASTHLLHVAGPARASGSEGWYSAARSCSAARRSAVTATQCLMMLRRRRLQPLNRQGGSENPGGSYSSLTAP